MIVPFNVEVVCADGPGGSIAGVVIHRLSLQVKQLVVKERNLLFIDHLGPVSWLLMSASHQVRLRCTRAELAALESSGVSDLSRETAWMYRYACWDYGMWTYLPATLFDRPTRSRLASSDLILSDRTHLKAMDGNVGHVHELDIDPDTDRIVQVTLREGRLWHQKHVTIPVAAIVGVTEEAITVALDRHSIEALPADKPAAHLHLFL